MDLQGTQCTQCTAGFLKKGAVMGNHYFEGVHQGNVGNLQSPCEITSAFQKVFRIRLRLLRCLVQNCLEL